MVIFTYFVFLNYDCYLDVIFHSFNLLIIVLFVFTYLRQSAFQSREAC